MSTKKLTDRDGWCQECGSNDVVELQFIDGWAFICNSCRFQWYELHASVLREKLARVKLLATKALAHAEVHDLSGETIEGLRRVLKECE